MANYLLEHCHLRSLQSHNGRGLKIFRQFWCHDDENWRTIRCPAATAAGNPAINDL
jgi:hypothetical protein